MSAPTVAGLDRLIRNRTVRRVIYAAYAAVALIVGGVAVYYTGTGHALPEVVTGAQAVVAWAAIPVAALAGVNAPKQGAEAKVTEGHD